MWGSQSTKGRASNQRTFCLFTWTHLAALSIYFLRILAGVSTGAVDFLALLLGDITGAQHALHNAKCPEVWVPGLAVGIGLSIGNTHWKRTQDWKLKAGELKWAPVPRAQALNPLRHQASFVLVVPMEVCLQSSLCNQKTACALLSCQQLFRTFNRGLWMPTRAWHIVGHQIVCFKWRNEWMHESRVLAIQGVW